MVLHPRPRQREQAAALEWARSSAGEHYVDIVGVTGSIPVAPTILKARNPQGFAGLHYFWANSFGGHGARHPARRRRVRG